MWKSKVQWARFLRIAVALFILISADILLSRGQGRNAKELMLLAAKENGLGGDEVGPWHLKATYKVFDESGAVKDEGIYEELWVSSTKYKRIFTGKAFTQTDYGTEKTVMRAGSRDLVPVLLEEVRREFVNPFANADAASSRSFDVKEKLNGGAKLECLEYAGMPLSFGRTYCVGSDKPFLRVSSSAIEKEQILHNRILAFHDRFIAGDLEFYLEGKRRLTAHLENIESLDPVDDATFTPPADAVAMPWTLDISEGVAQGMLLKKVMPEYPFAAKQNQVTGTVVLQAVIGKNGHIKDLDALSGPDELKRAAEDAVRRWEYRPFLLKGQPVDVRTTINVSFTLGW